MITGKRRLWVHFFASMVALVIFMPVVAFAQLVSGLAGASGSTVGPANDLFVTEAVSGTITRVDPRTGATSTFATGLPPMIPAVGYGGPVDVAFIGETAYALVTLVGSDVGGSDVVGVYRNDGPNAWIVLADIGAFAVANPPPPGTAFIPSGVQYAIDAYHGGFLVTDGHHNRVLRVALDGTVSEFIAFGNIVPTGLAVSGQTVLMTQAGPAPHAAADGKVVAFRSFGPSYPTSVSELASGVELAVDVEIGRGQTLFALAQGVWDGQFPGSPAIPHTGALWQVHEDGSLTLVTAPFDRPTSLEIIRNTAYIVTLAGDIWTVENIGDSPFGHTH